MNRSFLISPSFWNKADKICDQRKLKSNLLRKIANPSFHIALNYTFPNYTLRFSPFPIATMAAELVGGALLSAFLQAAFDKLPSPQYVDFFPRRKFDEKLLGNLNIMLHSINSLANDAEQKQFRDPHVKPGFHVSLSC
ncbi:hypothetical protein VIGAN_11016300 [Vigna angularis var. angularis]|uniref:Uncharacterized protein n=1 Tax=Vigna angularis var. angularis TaxID=157739 RepID=A0A0S3T7T8_PHAAN|nr:hypothetical protein VIGAN_11016300 [Vigna angularis var. angularis]